MSGFHRSAVVTKLEVPGPGESGFEFRLTARLDGGPAPAEIRMLITKGEAASIILALQQNPERLVGLRVSFDEHLPDQMVE